MLIKLLSGNPFIPAQVISEYLNVTRRLLSLSKEELLYQASSLLARCTIVPVVPNTLLFASTLINKYNFQLFDAVVVAGALEGDCAILYSEGMHHGLIVEKTLTILNPFI